MYLSSYHFLSFSFFVSALAVTGCAPDTPKLDPKKSLETTCMDSFKLSLKDPDSIHMVANLGDRGVTDDKVNGFWLRYKAKNSYGAFDSKNVYCIIKSDGTAAQDDAYENLTVINEENSLIKAQIRGMKAGKTRGETNWGNTETLAKHTVFDSVDKLQIMNSYEPCPLEKKGLTPDC
jgi:hypothetical protein